MGKQLRNKRKVKREISSKNHLIRIKAYSNHQLVLIYLATGVTIER